MGTSAGTCAVSRLPIHEGDPVVVVTIRESVRLHMNCEGGGIGTYRVLTALSHLFMYDYTTLEEMQSEAGRAERRAFYAQRNDYITKMPYTPAGIEERIAYAIADKIDAIQSFVSDVVVTRGKYNEYSTVQNDKDETVWEWKKEHEQGNTFFIVHADIWDRLTANVTNQHKTLWKTVVVQPEHMHVERVYVFVSKCYLARIELIDHCELFPSDGRNEFWDAQQEIEMAISAAKKDKYNQQLERGWFDEDEDEE